MDVLQKKNVLLKQLVKKKKKETRKMTRLLKFVEFVKIMKVHNRQHGTTSNTKQNSSIKTDQMN